MTVSFAAVMFLFGSAVSRAEQAPDPAPPRILFIGNSYTRFNNLPRVFHDMAVGAGHVLPEVKAAIHNGMRLDGHLESPATLKLIDEGNWGFVIVQPQSQEAAMSEQFPEMRSKFLNGAAGLYDRIKAKSPQAVIVLYQTWARHSDYWQDAADRSVGDNPADMQARIRKWDQIAVAGKNDFMIAPVGDAWELNYGNPKALRLHQPDNSHPTYSGSYLTALVIYGTIFRPADLDVAYSGDLDRPEAVYLQSIATKARSRPAIAPVPDP